MGAPPGQPRARGGGGDLVPAPRTARRARVATAGGAIALASVLGAGASIGAERGEPVAAAALAVLMLAGALLTERPGPIPFALLLLATIHAVRAGETVLATPLYGSALLLAGELAYWSLDERPRQRVEAGVARRRLLAVLAIAAAAIPAGALVLAAARLDLPRSPALTAAGAVALVACVALLTAMARRAPSDV